MNTLKRTAAALVLAMSLASLAPADIKTPMKPKPQALCGPDNPNWTCPYIDPYWWWLSCNCIPVTK